MRRLAARALMLGLLCQLAAPLTAMCAAPPVDAPRQLEMPRAMAPGDWLPQAPASDTLARPPQVDPLRLPLAVWRPTVAAHTSQRDGTPSVTRPHRAHYPPRRMLRPRLARGGDDRPA